MLDGMNRKFANPYVIFYPVLSRDGMPFPVNKCLKEIQGPNFRENLAWRGNLVIAKYRDAQLSALMDATMADFPLLKNYLTTHYPSTHTVSPFLRFVPHLLPLFSQPPTSSRLLDCVKIIVHVLTRFPPPPAYSRDIFHGVTKYDMHRPRHLRLNHYFPLVPWFNRGL